MPLQKSDAFYIRGIPQKLKAKYKKMCAQANIGMTEGISRLLTLVTEDDGHLWQQVLRMPPTARDFNPKD